MSQVRAGSWFKIGLFKTGIGLFVISPAWNHQGGWWIFVEETNIVPYMFWKVMGMRGYCLYPSCYVVFTWKKMVKGVTLGPEFSLSSPEGQLKVPSGQLSGMPSENVKDVQSA